MTFPCSKKKVAVVFCILECLFLSGLLNGWMWMKQILKHEDFFLDCNITRQTFTNAEDTDSLMGILKTKEELKKNKEGERTTCVYKRVLKVVTYKEYAKMEHIKKASDDTRVKADSVVVNATDYECSKGTWKIDFVFQMIGIAKDISIFPVGLFLDRYGTSRGRIIAM